MEPIISVASRFYHDSTSLRPIGIFINNILVGVSYDEADADYVASLYRKDFDRAIEDFEECTRYNPNMFGQELW